MNPTFRKFLSWLHTWSGLTLGLVIVMFAITGAALVVQLQFDSIVNGDLLVVPECLAPQSLDTLAVNAKASHPSAELRAIEVTSDSGVSVAIQFTDLDYVYLDPCSAAVLGTQNRYGGFFGTLDWLHRFHFMDEGYRKQVAGWVTVIFMVILIIGGLALWWPRTKAALKNASKFNPRLPGTARTLSLHKVLGLYTSLILLLITLTALPVSFPPIKAFIYGMTGYVAPVAPLSTLQNSEDYYSMEGALQKSRERFPTAEWVTINYPKTKDDAVRIEILEPGMPHRSAKSHLYLDAWTGRELGVSHYATDVNLGRKIYLYSVALHAALVWGLPYQVLLLLGALAIPVQVYSGFSPYLRRKFRVKPKTTLSLKITGKLVEATDVSSFELASIDGTVLPAFSAGAHVDVHLDKDLIRQYSLCNDPREKHRYLIAVLREPDSRGGSEAMHDDLKPGDTLEVGLPKNHFQLSPGASKSLLIAGGIGITPILCMAEKLSSTGAEFSMHYCVRSADRAAFLSRIRQSTFADQVTLHVSNESGRPDLKTLLVAVDPETHIYVCGPGGFIDAVLAAAAELGWPEPQVHREYFEAVERDADNDVAFDVKIASTGKIIHIPKDKSVTTVLAENGIDIPTSCSEGICATCLTGVLEGEVEHNDMVLNTEQRAKDDQFMPCCSRARSELLVLDL